MPDIPSESKDTDLATQDLQISLPGPKKELNDEPVPLPILTVQQSGKNSSEIVEVTASSDEVENVPGEKQVTPLLHADVVEAAESRPVQDAAIYVQSSAHSDDSGASIHSTLNIFLLFSDLLLLALILFLYFNM
jgi:hypothetical protein